MAITRSQSRGGSGLIRIQQEIERRRRWRKRYKLSDVTKRHRLPDRQPKSVHVTTYTRRN